MKSAKLNRARAKADAPGVCWTVESAAKSVVTIRVQVPTTPSEWDFWALLRSDVHHDNVKSRRDMEKRHLDEAKDRGAAILDFGDLFCAMQGKYDKRSSMSDLRPEHVTTGYLDALVNTAAEFYTPFARNFALIGEGNHETSVYEKTGTSLTQRLVGALRERGSPCVAGGYSGWVRFLFTRDTTRLARTLWWIHGYGGGGPVTQDMIQANRQMVYVDGADFMVSGHTHDAWCQDRVKVRLTHNGNVEHRKFFYIKTPTYKDEYGDGRGGWHIQTGKPPKPLGAWWIRFTYRNDQIHEQIIRAT